MTLDKVRVEMSAEKQRIDLVALDLDGTLTNEKKQVTERTKQAIWRAQEAGMRIALASGRPYAGCRPVAEALELEKRGGYILAFNGGQILECHTGTVLHSKEIAKDLLPEIFRAGERFGVTALTYEGDKILSEHPEDCYVQQECFINQIEVRQVASLEQYVTWPVPKCLLVGEHDQLLPVKAYLEETFQDALSIYFSESYFLEIMAEGVNKARGLKLLTERLKSSREHILACGDGLNDISMIQYAGLGVAMANACEEAKAAADWLAPSNEEDGVAQVLEQLLGEMS